MNPIIPDTGPDTRDARRESTKRSFGLTFAVGAGGGRENGLSIGAYLEKFDGSRIERNFFRRASTY